MSRGMWIVIGLLLAAGEKVTQAQALPETYSFTADSEMMGKMTIKVNRNGSKEVVESIGDSGGFHLRQLYDFQAHRVYTLDLRVNACTTQEYTSPYAPATQDPIGSAAEMIKGLGSLPALGRENVNGIAARVTEAALQGGRGKYKYWLEEKYSFPVKMALTLGSQPERLLFEMRQLSYGPSAESLFVQPPGCGAVSGVSSATGGHAESSVDVKVTQTHVLGHTGAGAAKVTAVRMRLVPENYAGPCPSKVQLVGEITTNGAGTVWYEFLAGAVRKTGPALGTIRFSEAGTKTVTLDAEYVRTPSVPNCSLIAVMANADGSRGPQNLTSGPVKFNASCTGVR